MTSWSTGVDAMEQAVGKFARAPVDPNSDPGDWHMSCIYQRTRSMSKLAAVPTSRDPIKSAAAERAGPAVSDVRFMGFA